MRKKIEDTCREIARLKEICDQHRVVEGIKTQMGDYGYYAAKLDILQDRLLASESQAKYQAYEENRKKALDDMEMREQEIKDLTDQEEELLRQISMTGYEQLKGCLLYTS